MKELPAWTFETVSTCPMCGCETHRAVHASLRRCRRCQVYFRSPRPTVISIMIHYGAGLTYARWRTEQAVRDRLWRRRLALLLRHVRGGRLLDVGSGDGHFLDHARGHFAVIGTEVNATAVELARRRGHALVLGDLSQLRLAAGAFDVVTMWHVLEHLPEPGKTLALVRSLLRPGGVLALAVPYEAELILQAQVQDCWRRRARPLSFAPGDEVHLTHFTPRTLRAALRRLGFALEVFTIDDAYTRRTLSSLVLLGIQRLSQRLIGWQPGGSMAVIARKPSTASG
jgi:SAM-dependent methyltransferase